MRRREKLLFCFSGSSADSVATAKDQEEFLKRTQTIIILWNFFYY